MTTSVEKRQHELSIVRDTVESVWVAIILAFVLRAFMVEAFVIPTGSMAPRLMGEHYDLVCPACGYEYSYRWQRTDKGSVTRRSQQIPDGVSHCPSCTYVYQGSKQIEYVNGGDRVLVMKYLYRFVEPKPFDVVVFRNPQSNANNYIKRLIGLPGETIEIVHGDVFVKDKDKPKPEIRRKPDRAQEVMWQIICDNDYQPDRAILKKDMKIDAPRRWVAPTAGADTQTDPWAKTNNGRTFTFKGSPQRSYLTFKGARYEVDPGYLERSTMEKVKNESMREAFLPRYGYNDAGRERRYINPNIDLCSDLRLSVVVRPGEAKSAAECVLDCMRFSFRALFDTDGSITVFRKLREATQLKPAGGDAWGEPWARAKTAPMVAGVGRKVELAHVDHGVKVWVDGEKVDALEKNYTVPLDVLKQRLADAVDTPLPRPGARIGAVGGPLEFTHLKLMRDVYYTDFSLAQPDGPPVNFLMDYANKQKDKNGDKPTPGSPGWGVAGNPIELRKRDVHKGENPDLDEFFVLGDNSPQSLDSRGWIQAAPSLRLFDEDDKPQYRLGTVPRYNMIGKAMFVYWPSGFRLPLLPGLPIVPDVGRMRLIR